MAVRRTRASLFHRRLASDRARSTGAVAIAATCAVERLEGRQLLATAWASVAPGFTPGEMVASPTQNIVYVLDTTDNKVVAIDTALGRKVAHASVPGVPRGVAISVEQDELYVSATAENRIAVYSLPDLMPLRTLNVTSPGLLAAGVGDWLYLADSSYGNMRKVDANTGAVMLNFTATYGAHAVTNAAGTRMFASALGWSTTSTAEYDISQPDGTPVLVKSHDTAMSNGREVVLDEAANKIYAMSGGVYGVRSVDMSTGTGATWGFTGGGVYGTAVATNKNASFIWAGSQVGGVQQFNRTTGAAGEYIATGAIADRGMRMTANTNTLFRRDTGNLGIIGRSTLTIASIPDARFATSRTSTQPGLSLTFDGTLSSDFEATGSIASYKWSFGDGSTATASTVTKSYTAPGTYAVTLTVTDNAGNTDDFTQTIRVSNKPVAQNLTVSTNEDTPKTIALLATDPDANPLTYRITAAPTHGTLALNGSSVLYTPDADYFGTDSFSYVANDGALDSNTAVATITVASVNDAPRLKDDVAPLPRNATSIAILPLANDIEVEGETMSITGFTQPTRGTVTRSGSTFTYTPLSNFQAFDTFTYSVSDASGHSSTASVKVASGIAVLDGDWSSYGNDAARTGALAGFIGSAEPIESWSLAAGQVNPKWVTTGGGRVYMGLSQGSDTQYLKAFDANTGALLWTLTQQVGSLGHGIEQPTYFNGKLYVRSAAHSGSQMLAVDAATGTLLWRSANATQWENFGAPAVSDIGIWGGGGSYGGMQGWRFDGSQIAFFYGPQISTPWTPSIAGQNVYRLTTTNFEKFSANGSQLFSVPMAQASFVPVLGGDKAFITSSAGLQAARQSDGGVAWTAAGAFQGDAAFKDGVVFALSGSTIRSFNASTGAAISTFTAGSALTGQPIVTDDAVIAASATSTYIFSRDGATLLHTLPFGGEISLAQNRLYIVGNDGSVRTYLFARAENNWPTAGTDSATTAEETAVTLSPLTNDTDPDAGNVLRLTSVAAPLHGTAAIQPGGKIVYTPALNYFGSDTFTYTVVDDRGGKATGTVTINVTNVNDPPTAPALTIYTATNIASPITVAGVDVDNDPLTYAITLPPLNGTVTGTGPNFIYTPNAGFGGSDTFYYTVNDGTSTSAPGLVTVIVNDAPTVANVTQKGYEDTAITIALSGADINGDSLSFSVVTPPANGTYTISGRFLTYRPRADYFGTDTLTYRAFDGIRYSTVDATATLNVLNVNDAPVGTADTLPVAVGSTTISQDLLANDVDVDRDALTIASFTQPAHGTISRFGGGRLRYVADPTFSGLDQFTYTVSDGNGGASSATVDLSIGSPQLNGDWKTFGNGADHTGYFGGHVLGGTFVPGWSSPSSDTSSYQQAVVAGGSVFLVARNMFAVGLDAATGAEQWRHVFPSGHSLNPATYYDGRLYLQRGNHGSDTQLFALDPSNGNTIWSSAFSAQWESYLAPAVNDKGIWINGGYYGGMYGFRPDGTQITFVSLAQYDSWTPSLLGDNVYSYVAGSFVKYDAAGTALWTNTHAWNWSGYSMQRTTALVGKSAFLIGQPDLYAVDTDTGVTKWTVPGNFTGTAAVANGIVYATSGSNVNAYNAETGAFIRSYAAGAPINSSQPIVTDDAMFVSTSSETIVFHLGSGGVLQRIGRAGNLALSNNTLYVTPFAGGGIYTYKLASPSTVAPAAPSLAASSDTGVSASDNYTSATQPTFAGVAAAGTKISLFSDGTLIGSTTATSAGTWQATSTLRIADGVHEITLMTGDSVSGLSSAPLMLTIDAAPPTANITFDVDHRQLVLLFNEPINVATQLQTLTIVNRDTGAAMSGLAGRYDAQTFKLVFDLAGTLANGRWRATIASGAISDRAGNAGAGTLDFGYLAGDVNSDGKVDFKDLVLLAQNYNKAGKTFSEGNVNFSADGKVDFADLVILAQNMNRALPTSSASTTVAAMAAASPHKRESVAADIL